METLILFYVFFSYVAITFHIGVTSDMGIFEGLMWLLSPISVVLVLLRKLHEIRF